MGAGKGKTKRAQTQPRTGTQAQPTTHAISNNQAWKTFIKDHGLQNQTTSSYYQTTPTGLARPFISGIPASLPKQYTPAEAHQIITELFQDFVVTNALTLPAQHSTGDYKLLLCPKAPAPNGHEIVIRNRQTKHEATLLVYPEMWIEGNDKLTSYNTERILEELYSTLNSLLNAQRNSWRL